MIDNHKLYVLKVKLQHVCMIKAFRNYCGHDIVFIINSYYAIMLVTKTAGKIWGLL